MYKQHWFIILLTVLLSVALVSAQAEDCAAFVQQALDTVGENCDEMPRNQACYGNNRLRASFQESVAADFFSQPSDQAELTSMSSIEGLPYMPSTDEWGIGVLNVQANVPNTLPGQAVTFMLLGETQVENGVDAEDAFSPVDGITVQAVAGTNFRSGPGLNFNVVSSSGGGGEYNADAISADSEWLRIMVDSTPLWVFRELIANESVEVTDLPVLSDDLRTPMQAFYFNSGIGELDCQEAPNSLVIQSAPSMEVTLDMNGLTIEQGSTVVYEFVEADVIQITVFEGAVKLSETFTIPVGATAFVRTENDGTIIPDSWYGFRSIVDQEYDQYFWMEFYDQSFFRPLGRFIRQPQVTSCDTFIRTAPINQTISAAPVDFYWNPPLISEVTRYQVLFYNENNQPTDSFFVDAPSTTLRVDVGQLKTGSVLRWEVFAYIGDEVVCTTEPGAFQVRESGTTPEDITRSGGDDDDDDGGGSCSATALAGCP